MYDVEQWFSTCGSRSPSRGEGEGARCYSKDSENSVLKKSCTSRIVWFLLLSFAIIIVINTILVHFSSSKIIVLLCY
jgi:hypothetical protein